MKKRVERYVLSLMLALLMAGSVILYLFYIQRQVYTEGTQAMLETYEQVDKTFTMFAQRNWNVLTDWGNSLRDMADPTTATEWRDFKKEKQTWNYSDFYMVNEDWNYWTVDGRSGVGENIRPAFEKLYEAGEPTVASYTATSGKRKVVFMVPCDPIELDGVTYTSLAVSYDNDVMEEMIGGRAYGGRSDCYIIYPNGNILLSEEPKSEITDRMWNLFDYLEHNATYNVEHFARMQEEIAQGESGSIEYRFGGWRYYLVYQPVGFQNLTIVGIVERNVVDAGMHKVQTVTILLLILLSVCVGIILIQNIKTDALLRLEERERALRQEAEARRQMENLANTDGLTGLFNERYFNETLKARVGAGQPFALFYLDLDHFKPVNDTYGHDVGDQLLRAVAGRLQGCVRSSDFAFRIGGDEFALILDGALTEAFCGQKVELIRSTIDRAFTLDGRTIQVGTSCGYAVYPADSADVREIRILADQRMYEDKQARRGDGPDERR